MTDKGQKGHKTGSLDCPREGTLVFQCEVRAATAVHPGVGIEVVPEANNIFVVNVISWSFSSSFFWHKIFLGLSN